MSIRPMNGRTVRPARRRLTTLGVPDEDPEGLRQRCRDASFAAWMVYVVVALVALQLLFSAFAHHAYNVEKGLGVPLLVYCVAPLAYVAYWLLLSKPLLARRKLHELVALAPLRRGLASVWVPGVLSAIALGVALPLLHAESADAQAWRWLIDLLAITIVVSGAMMMAHCAEYAIVAAAFSARRPEQLAQAIHKIGEMAVERLDDIQQNAVHDKTLDTMTAADLYDVLPDREMTAAALQSLVQRLERRLDSLAKSMAPWIKAHGIVALLFHPDYLPHMSSSELQVSQLRALNIVPRRVQLLTRRWSLSGLESEYVVVHDVSEILPGFSDPKETKPKKWRLRTLKKRAVVHLAPDGALRLIAIEEEHQFNI